MANDVNPLSLILTRPRFFPPLMIDIEDRLSTIEFTLPRQADIDLSMFYHPDTEAEIISLRSYLKGRKNKGEEDDIDAWIRMVATDRLTGHSRGFFSVYTLPPNQAVSPGRQIAIYRKRNQKPEYREVRSLILKKSGSLLRGLTGGGREILREAGESGLFLTLVVGSSLITATLLRNDEPLVAQRVPAAGQVGYANAAFGPGQSLDPAYETARHDLARTLSERIDRLPPDARRQVEKNLAVIRRASAEINAALEQSPGDPLLVELLLNAYQDELALLASVNQLAGGNGTGRSMRRGWNYDDSY